MAVLAASIETDPDPIFLRAMFSALSAEPPLLLQVFSKLAKADLAGSHSVLAPSISAQVLTLTEVSADKTEENLVSRFKTDWCFFFPFRSHFIY